MVIFGKRRQKVIAPFVLAFWLFAIFVSVAHACGIDDALGHSGWSEAAKMGGHDEPHKGALPACDKFCSDDLAVLAKLKAVQDPPAGPAIHVTTLVGESFHAATASVRLVLLSPDPPPGINVNIHFVRLAL